MFAQEMTPEMRQRLARVVIDVLQLLQDDTETAEEALIVLDETKRMLSAAHGLLLVCPMDGKTAGQA